MLQITSLFVFGVVVFFKCCVFFFRQVRSPGETLRGLSWEEPVHPLPLADRRRHGHEHDLQGIAGR